MSDDLDDLLRRSMKTLDDQVPSGYFEGLPKQVQGALARQEDSTNMQTTENMGSDPKSTTGAPPPATREEDSGLHDIRSLASSTKARLSSRRSTQNPIVTDDDVLASSSAGWKAVALPEPAKMISLPELASLPSKTEIKAQEKAHEKAQEKAAKKAAQARAAEDAVVASSAAALETRAAPAAELPAAAPSTPMIGSRIAGAAPRTSKGKGGTIALVGIGLAAAAGAVFFFGFYNKDTKTAPAATVAKAEPTELPKMTAPMLPPPAAKVEAPAATETAAPVVTPIEPPAPAPAPADDKAATKEPKQKVHKVEIRDTPKEPKPEVAKPEPKKVSDGTKKDPDAGDPSFDQLLKEAGVSDQKKEAKPVLAKKSLSGDDIKHGMGGVEGRALKCYAGTQGTASVKLTVAPSGKVEKVHVSGAFAGTPVAACVEAAVRGASFPPWDGGPQTFGYSYLLAE